MDQWVRLRGILENGRQNRPDESTVRSEGVDSEEKKNFSKYMRAVAWQCDDLKQTAKSSMRAALRHES